MSLKSKNKMIYKKKNNREDLDLAKEKRSIETESEEKKRRMRKKV